MYDIKNQLLKSIVILFNLFNAKKLTVGDACKGGITDMIYAAGMARSYNGGGYNDWHLPGKEELNQLYLNKSLIGGFHNFFYWSSTEYDKNSVWLQFFSNGVKFSCLKSGPYYVRAVRTF